MRNGRDTTKSMAAIFTLMTSGTETTNTTCIWLLYLLSRHPDKQEKLYQEIISAVDQHGEILASNAPLYLKAALKESQRIYPTTRYVLPRVFDKDLGVLGYHVPSGVYVLMHGYIVPHNERHHGKDPLKFLPERWLRDERGRIQQKINPFTFLPFGYGVRMCVGRRMAEAMIYSLVSKILCTYRLEYADEFDIGVDLSMREGMLLKPDRPVSLKFLPRQ